MTDSRKIEIEIKEQIVLNDRRKNEKRQKAVGHWQAWWGLEKADTQQGM